MKPVNKSTCRSQRGFALIISMIFILIFSAMAVSMASLSGTNAQIANNQRFTNQARAAAESGLEAMRFWLSRFQMPSSTPLSDYFDTVINNLQSDLAANQVSNIVVSNNGLIGSVMLDSVKECSYSSRLYIDPANPTVLQVTITGIAGDMTRRVGTCFTIAPYEYPIFNFGMATKGALHFPQNPTLSGANHFWEADIYIESMNDSVALFAGGNINLDGDISIGNPLGSTDFQQDVIIAEEHGQSAIDNHVFIGVDPVEFPVADTAHFQQYTTGSTIDSLTDTTSHITLTNSTISAGTNPTFEGNVIIEGILFIESPNIIVFNSNVQLNGLIVGDGGVINQGTNAITFRGNFATGPYPAGAEFDDIRQRQVLQSSHRHSAHHLRVTLQRLMVWQRLTV